MKVEQQPAYVLHARPFSESSSLIDVFTREHGRLMLLAKGARRGKSKWRGVLLPFKLLLASWAGKGQLPSLTAAEHILSTSAPPASADGCSQRASMRGGALASGFYLNELLLKLLHRHDAHERLFEQYDLALRRLAQDESPRHALRVFEKNLLQQIGFGAALERDAETGEAIAADERYRYVPEKGPVRAARASDGDRVANTETETADARAQSFLVIRGSTLQALRDEAFPSDLELREAQRLTRMLIDRQLSGRALRSRRVMVEMKQRLDQARQSPSE
ncbi:MAG: DNA repair protein RecO [bacterium]